MNKILTIIIPTYNMEKYLRKCLDSLIVSEENMQQLEVLVVNDGSKDSSSQIAHEYEAKYPQTFRVIDKENGNYGSCVNRGLKEATGKYVKVLDADDYFDNQVFDEYLSFLNNKDVDLVISDYCIVDENDAVQESYTFPLPLGETFTLNNLTDETIHWLWHQGVAYKTDNLREMNYRQTEGISYTDEEWMFKPMSMVNSIQYFPNNLYLYLRGREGQTFDPKIMMKDMEKRFIVVNSLLDYYYAVYDKSTADKKRYYDLELFAKTRSLYSFFLIKKSTREGNIALSELDKKMSQQAKNVVQMLNGLQTRFGAYYVRQWRDAGYNRHIPVLLYIQFRFRCSLLFGGKVQDLHMDKKYQRKQ